MSDGFIEYGVDPGKLFRPKNVSGSRIDYRTDLTRRAAAPRCDDIVPGEIDPVAKRFRKHRPVPPRLRIALEVNCFCTNSLDPRGILVKCWNARSLCKSRKAKAQHERTQQNALFHKPQFSHHSGKKQKRRAVNSLAWKCS